MSLGAQNANHQGDRSEDIDISYWTVQPNKWTFESPKIREWCESWLSGRVLNVCAGPTQLSHDGEVIRNDLDEDLDVDYHYDAREISEHFSQEFDTVVFDPPFSAFQAQTHYGGRQTGYDTAIKRELHEVLRAGGRVIQFGYTTTCMPLALGYDREAVAVFNTLGRQNDILGSVDRRMNNDVREYE